MYGLVVLFQLCTARYVALSCPSKKKACHRSFFLLCYYLSDICPRYPCPVLPHMADGAFCERTASLCDLHTAARAPSAAGCSSSYSARRTFQIIYGQLQAAELAELAISSSNQRTNFVTILIGFGYRDWSTSLFSRTHHSLRNCPQPP